jgi:tripartite-type tricarboxylate transporter receptor subunit TctC
MGHHLGQQVVVENRPGANGNLGAEAAAKLPGDGYSLLLISSSHAINVSLYRKLAYDLLKDFVPVGMVGSIPNSVVVHPSLGANSIAELVAMAKRQPGKISYASSGSGSPEHITGELFKAAAGIDLQHVPYKGSGQSVIDLTAGHVPIGFNTLPSILPHARSGKLKLLAVTTARRTPSSPDTPTLAESGLAGFDMSTWYALMAPAGTPPEMTARLNAALGAALAEADVRTRFQTLGADVRTSTPAELGTYVRSEAERFRKVVEATGTRLD